MKLYWYKMALSKANPRAETPRRWWQKLTRPQWAAIIQKALLGIFCVSLCAVLFGHNLAALVVCAVTISIALLLEGYRI
jgi:hypothetical protein